MKCRKNILEVVPFCEQSGTRLALETIWNFTEQTGEKSSLGETEEEFLEIVNFSDSECLGIHIDTGHSHLLGNLMRMVELAGDRLFSFNIHDNHGQREGGHWDEHLIPGEGDVDWERFMSILANVNYNEALVVAAAAQGPHRESLRVNSALDAVGSATITTASGMGRPHSSPITSLDVSFR